MQMPVEVNIFSPNDDASAIRGFTVVVDVFRAFSVSYYILANNPAKYIISESIEHSQELKARYEDVLLIGERQGIKIDGFDYGNSPTEITGRDFSGKTVVHTTTAGTKGLLLQPEQNEVVVGSFVNLQAIIDYIHAKKIDKVNIYGTALPEQMFGEEDYLYADYLKKKITGEPCDFEDVFIRLRKGSGKGFSETGFAPATDLYYCLDISRFDSILGRKLVDEEHHGIELEKIKT